MEEKVLVGFQWGTFTPDGQKGSIPFASVFVLEPFPDVSGSGSDFHFDGLKACKYKLADPEVVKESGAGMFDVCEFYYSSKGVVTKVVKTSKSVMSSMGTVGGDDASAVFLCLIYEVGGLPGEIVVLAVHFMVKDVILLDGTEGAKSYVKSDKSRLYAFSTYLVQHLRSKVQTCRGSSRRAQFAGINCLVAFAVLELFSDIRR